MTKSRKVPLLVLLIWVALLFELVSAIYLKNWIPVLVTTATLALTVLTIIFKDRFEIKLPMRFAAAIVVFVFATLFLGDVKDFYERFWWWDAILHGFSALAFGLLGFVCIFMLFDGDRFAAPPLAIALLSFCVAVCIGAVWEIFEFAMDQIFGLNMQKSGLVDTMWDLIVDCLGAFTGAFAGYLYLKSGEGTLAGWIEDFVGQNRKRFGKLRKLTPKEKSEK